MGRPARRAARGPLACLPLTAARWAAASPPGPPVRLLGHLHRCRALLGRLPRWAGYLPTRWAVRACTRAWAAMNDWADLITIGQLVYGANS